MSKRKGFTLIEVSLFLAVTAALFMGVALGMQNSIEQQRYNDATQSFLNFMRNIYSEVSNPQSPGAGNSNEAIYGKLVVFGESVDLLGNDIPKDDYPPIFTYDVVASASTASGLSSGDVRKSLKDLGANVVRIEDVDSLTKRATLVTPEKYEVPWGAVIEDTDGDPMTMSIMVVRHPRSGSLNTLVLGETIDVNAALRNYNQNNNSIKIKELLTQYLENDKFKNNEDVDFCVNPYGKNEIGVVPRQDIRLLANARNASGVEMIGLDDNSKNGNKCNSQ